MTSQKSQNCSRLRHLVSHRYGQRIVYVAPLTIHLDDSGTHTTSRVAAVGAWIAPVKMWERFTAEWNRALEKHGIEEFHMAEFIANNHHSEFADLNVWNDDKKRAVLSRLTQIARMRTLKGFGFAVNVSEYNSAIPEKFRKICGTYHYTWVVRTVLGFVEEWCTRQGIREPTEYIFDRMCKKDAKAEIERVFEESEASSDELHKYGIYKGCYSFRDRRDVIPLQASDMVAWLLNQRAQHETEAKPVNPIAVKFWNELVKEEHLKAGITRGHHLSKWFNKEATCPGTGIYNLMHGSGAG